METGLRLATRQVLFQNVDAKLSQAGVRTHEKVNLGGIQLARESIFHDEKLDFLAGGKRHGDTEIAAVLAGMIEQVLSMKGALNETIAIFDPLDNTKRTRGNTGITSLKKISRES